MSSYTISTAYTAAEIRAAQEAELERRRKALADAIIEHTEVCEKIAALINNVEEDHDKEIALVSHKDELEITLDMVCVNKKTYIKKMRELQKAVMPSEASDIRRMNARLRNESSALYAEYEESVKEFLERISQNIAADARIEELNKLSEKFAGAKIELGYVDIHIKHMDEYEEIRQTAKGVINEIASIIRNENVLSDDRKRLKDIKSKIGAVLAGVEENKSMLQTLLFEYKSIRRMVYANAQETQGVYEKYLSEFIIYTNLLNSVRKEKMPIVPLMKDKFLSCQVLKDEVNKLVYKSRLFMERHYIAEQIREVMELYGYKFCDDIHMDETLSDTEYICAVNGDTTGVHVNVGYNGEIMMEVVLNEDIEPKEAEDLVEKQYEFCALREDIVEELAERGVIICDKRCLEPGCHMKKIKTKKLAGKKSSVQSHEKVASKERDTVDIEQRRRAKCCVCMNM